ncbi:MAG: hypothetical protein AB7P20_03075 [Rhizobiaceae bacterium]
MSAAIFYHGGGFEVTDTLLRTPRKTYSLARIEYVSVTRPLLFFAGPPAIGAAGFALAFYRYLYAGEIAALAVAATAALVAASLLGTLRVHSLALRDDEIAQSFGPIWRLRQVRRAVERAMTGAGQRASVQ